MIRVRRVAIDVAGSQLGKLRGTISVVGACSEGGPPVAACPDLLRPCSLEFALVRRIRRSSVRENSPSTNFRQANGLGAPRKSREIHG